MKKASNTTKWRPYASKDGTFDIEALTPNQKEALYEECERLSNRKTQPLTPTQRKLHQQARGRGRPRMGQGTQIVSLSIEKSLLRQAEQFARAQGISRSDLFSRGLRAVLAAAAA